MSKVNATTDKTFPGDTVSAFHTICIPHRSVSKSVALWWVSPLKNAESTVGMTMWRRIITHLVCVCVCCLVPQCHNRAYKCFRNRWPLRLSSCYSNLKACLLEGPWAVTEIQCLVKPPIKVQRWWWPTIEFLSYLDCLFYNLVGFRGSNTWNSTDKAFLPGRWSARQIDSKSDRKSQIMKF